MTATVTLAGLRDCEAALRNPDLKQALYDAGKVVMEGALVALHGEEHTRRRTVEVRVFRRNFFRHYEETVFPKTAEATLAPFIAAGRFNLVELGYHATVNLTADFAGIDRPLQSREETASLIALVKKFSEGATLVHSTRDRAEVEAEVLTALAEFDGAFLQASIKRRQDLIDQADAGAISEEALPRDVLTVILRAKNELGLDNAQIRREVAFYMQAGAHSTANAVIHSLDEIFEWAGADAARWERLRNPLFVQRCVHESLRLHPASPEAWRTGTCPMRVSGAGEIGVGDRVVLDLYSANRDRSVFGDDADLFDPDRTVPAGLMATGLTFGIGVHTCLGRELDGGVPAKPDTDPVTHQYGIVAQLVIRLLALGARRDPDDPPSPDPNTSRPNWGRYPIILTKVPA